MYVCLFVSMYDAHDWHTALREWQMVGRITSTNTVMMFDDHNS